MPSAAFAYRPANRSCSIPHAAKGLGRARLCNLEENLLLIRCRLVNGAEGLNL
jgi:hypothetical protein